MGTWVHVCYYYLPSGRTAKYSRTCSSASHGGSPDESTRRRRLSDFWACIGLLSPAAGHPHDCLAVCGRTTVCAAISEIFQGPLRHRRRSLSRAECLPYGTVRLTNFDGIDRLVQDAVLNTGQVLRFGKLQIGLTQNQSSVLWIYILGHRRHPCEKSKTHTAR